MVDVYVSQRCIASCPVDSRLDKSAAINAAKTMMKEDGILTDIQVAGAAFRVRRDEEDLGGVL